MTISGHPFLSGLLGDEEIAGHLSADADITAMLAFEGSLAEAEAAAGLIPVKAAEAIISRLKHFVPDLEGLKLGTLRDGVVLPELLSQIRSGLDEKYREYLHFGATSQDVIDTSLAIRICRILELLDNRLGLVIDALDSFEERDGDTIVMAHTRMQPALPVPAARKIASWRAPLQRHRDRFAAVRKNVAILHFGGPVGTLERLDGKGSAISRRMAAQLNLEIVPQPRHSERDGVAELANWLSLITGSLGKFGMDLTLGAQLGEIKLAQGGMSSAMPHKANPVGSEILVALARFNATLLAGMHHSLVHENERSGAAWTLEWMILPQMMEATGASLATALRLSAIVSFISGEPGS